MASNIAELHEQLLSLMKRRVEIDLEWIATSEKLLAEKPKFADAATQVEMPQLSEITEPRSGLSPVATTTEIPPPPVISNESDVTDTDLSHRIMENPSLTTSQEVHTSPAQEDAQNGAQTISSFSEHPVPPPPTNSPAISQGATLLRPDVYAQRMEQTQTPDLPAQPTENPQLPAATTNLGEKQFLRSRNPSIQRSPVIETAKNSSLHREEEESESESEQEPDSRSFRASHHQLQLYQQQESERDSISQRLPEQLVPADQPIARPWHTQLPNQPQVLPYAPQFPPGMSEFYQHGQFTNHPSYPHQAQLPAVRYFPRAPSVADTSLQYMPQPRDFVHPAFHGRLPPPRGSQTFPYTAPMVASYQPMPLDMDRGRSLRRERSYSLEVMDERPRQRRRIMDETNTGDRIMTPPLNDRRIKVEKLIEPDSRPPRASRESSRAPAVPASSSDFRRSDNVQRPFKQIHEPDVRQTRASSRRSRRDEQSVVRSSRHKHRAVEARNEYNHDEESEPENEAGEDPESQRKSSRPRAMSGTPAVIAEYEPEVYAPLRLGAKKPFGAYRVAEYKALTSKERQQLELRYCCHVAKIIGSKRCVVEPAKPFHMDKNIFQIMKDKFDIPVENGVAQADPDFHYRSASDFVNDARGMLKQYVRLGHCQDCQFKVTGNARVMCWRMRLESVLDEKMRGLKKCLKECEEGYEPGDLDGRSFHVDNWFSPEEFIDEEPLG